MKIALDISRDFKFLSDDSREVSKDCAFFVTQSSQK